MNAPKPTTPEACGRAAALRPPGLRGVPASQNPYRAKRQRERWAAAREAAEQHVEFVRLRKRAEELVARDPKASASAFAYLSDYFPRHVRECGLTANDLRHDARYTATAGKAGDA